MREAVIALTVIIVSVIPALERKRTSGFNSDDAAWLVGLHTWRPGGGTLVLVENTYLLHMPFLLVADLILPVSSWTLFVTAVALHAAGLWLIVSFARHAVAEATGTVVQHLSWRADMLAVAAVATYQVLSPMTRASNAGLTTRNLEAGVALLVLRWGYEYLSGRWEPLDRRMQLLIAAAVAVLALDDPLIVGTMFVPALFVFVVGALVDRVRRRSSVPARARSLIGPIAGGLVVWQVARLGLRTIGVRQADSPEGLAAPGEWWSHVRPVFGGLGQLVGRGLWRDDALVIQLIGVATFVMAIASVGRMLVSAVAGLNPKRRESPAEPAPRAMQAWLALGWFAIVTLTYFVSSAGAAQSSFRYVVVALPAVGVSVAVALATSFRRAVPVLWVIAPLAVLLAGTIGIVRDDDDRQDVAIVAAGALADIADQGYTRGYSGYWSGPIVTYYSDFVAPVLAVQCRDGFNFPFELLQDLGQFDRAVDDPRTRSFILVDLRPDEAWACPPGRLVEQHGTPDTVVPAGELMELWLYDDQDVVIEVLDRAGWTSD